MVGFGDWWEGRASDDASGGDARDAEEGDEGGVEPGFRSRPDVDWRFEPTEEERGVKG